MKTTTRRNVASLVFIAVLGIIYAAIILLTSRDAEGGEVVENANMPSAMVSSDSIATADTTTNAAKTSGKRRKSSSAKKGGSKGKSKQTLEPDRADVLDRPVDKIAR